MKLSARGVEKSFAVNSESNERAMNDSFIKLTPTVSYIGIVFHTFTLIGKRGREGRRGGGVKRVYRSYRSSYTPGITHAFDSASPGEQGIWQFLLSN